MKNIKKFIPAILNILVISALILPVCAFESAKNNVNYKSYEEKNNNSSEKVVAIYDKKSPACGYRYILYTPIGRYVGHHKEMQKSLNGGLEPIPEGGEGSSVPCFRTILEAKHYYYPQWY